MWLPLALLMLVLLPVRLSDRQQHYSLPCVLRPGPWPAAACALVLYSAGSAAIGGPRQELVVAADIANCWIARAAVVVVATTQVRLKHGPSGCGCP